MSQGPKRKAFVCRHSCSSYWAGLSLWRTADTHKVQERKRNKMYCLLNGLDFFFYHFFNQSPWSIAFSLHSAKLQWLLVLNYIEPHCFISMDRFVTLIQKITIYVFVTVLCLFDGLPVSIVSASKLTQTPTLCETDKKKSNEQSQTEGDRRASNRDKQIKPSGHRNNPSPLLFLLFVLSLCPACRQIKWCTEGEKLCWSSPEQT